MSNVKTNAMIILCVRLRVGILAQCIKTIASEKFTYNNDGMIIMIAVIVVIGCDYLQKKVTQVRQCPTFHVTTTFNMSIRKYAKKKEKNMKLLHVRIDYLISRHVYATF